MKVLCRLRRDHLSGNRLLSEIYGDYKSDLENAKTDANVKAAYAKYRDARDALWLTRNRPRVEEVRKGEGGRKRKSNGK